MNEPQRLTQAKQRLEDVVGRAGFLQFSIKANTRYENPQKSRSPFRTSALNYCYGHMNDKNALDNYINREQAVKARYYEMVAYRYDRQLKFL